jgi:hypothetical protein
MFFSVILNDVYQELKENIDKALEPCYSYDEFEQKKADIFQLLQTSSVGRHISELTIGKKYAILKPVSRGGQPFVPCTHKMIIEEYKYLGGREFCVNDDINKKNSFPAKILIEI